VILHQHGREGYPRQDAFFIYVMGEFYVYKIVDEVVRA
jgi:hypothetical protein